MPGECREVRREARFALFESSWFWANHFSEPKEPHFFGHEFSRILARTQ